MMGGAHERMVDMNGGQPYYPTNLVDKIMENESDVEIRFFIYHNFP